MAEILIQRKRRRSVWPWLLGVLALGLLLAPFVWRRDVDRAPRERVARRDSTARPDTAVPAAATDSVADSSSAARRTTATAAGAIAPAPAAPPAASPPSPDTATNRAADSTRGEATLDRLLAAGEPNGERAQRRYTVTGLRRLADELHALGASASGVRTIRLNADSLMSTARGSARPDFARAAFLAAVREFDVLGGRYAVTVDTGRLRATAWSIKPDRQLLEQRGRVQAFFVTARDALHSLSRRR